MQSNPRLLVNLPVSVKILANLLVKLTKLGRSIFDDLRPWSSWRLSPGVLVETGRARRRCPSAYERASPHCAKGPITRPVFTDFYRFLPIFRTFFLLPTFFLSRCVVHQLVSRVYYSPVSLPSFYRFFGLSWETIPTRLLFHITTVFFPADVLRRS